MMSGKTAERRLIVLDKPPVSSHVLTLSRVANPESEIGSKKKKAVKLSLKPRNQKSRLPKTQNFPPRLPGSFKSPDNLQRRFKD